MGEVGQTPATTDNGAEQRKLNEKLADAVLAADEDRVRHLILAGASPNTVIKASRAESGFDIPVIHEALDSGEDDIFGLLLDKGANLDAEDGKRGLSVLETLFCSIYDCRNIEACLFKGARLFRPERLRTSRWKSWFRVIALMVARRRVNDGLLNEVSLDLKVELIEVMLNRCLEIAIVAGDSDQENYLHDLIQGLIRRDDHFTLEKFEHYLGSTWFESAAIQPGGDYEKFNFFIMCEECLEEQKECETCQSTPWNILWLVRDAYLSLAEMVVNEVEEFRPAPLPDAEDWQAEVATRAPSSVGHPDDDNITSSDEEPPRKVARTN